MSALAPSLEAFFTDRLVGQRAASQNTIAAYALTFRLLLGFASARGDTPPSRLDIAQLDAPLVAAFLEHLERERGKTAATRNTRLAAIHSLFSYLALHHPEHAGSIGRVLSSRTSGPRSTSSPTSTKTRRSRSSRPAISGVGPADATTRCSL
jgi:integrase/recombinase XerD